MRHPIHRPSGRQSGFMLLEALIAILVFALGVLALVGLQTVSIKQSSQAKYRTDAVMFANELIGRMWVTDRSFATLNANFATGGPEYNTWLQRMQSQSALPGVAGANLPDVQVDPTNVVTVIIRWKAPNEPVADPAHLVTVVAQIR